MVGGILGHRRRFSDYDLALRSCLPEGLPGHNDRAACGRATGASGQHAKDDPLLTYDRVKLMGINSQLLYKACISMYTLDRRKFILINTKI